MSELEAVEDAIACRVENRRPRDLEAYREACAAAEGDDVEEIVAAAVCAGMTVRHCGKWLQVKWVRQTEVAALIDFVTSEPGTTASRTTSRTTPLYRRLPGCVPSSPQ